MSHKQTSHNVNFHLWSNIFCVSVPICARTLSDSRIILPPNSDYTSCASLPSPASKTIITYSVYTAFPSSEGTGRCAFNRAVQNRLRSAQLRGGAQGRAGGRGSAGAAGRSRHRCLPPRGLRGPGPGPAADGDRSAPSEAAGGAVPVAPLSALSASCRDP